MPSAQKFWYEALINGSLDEESAKWPKKIEVESLYKKYIEFVKIIKERHPMPKSEFGKELSKVCQDISRKQITFSSGSRAWCYELPDLEECRKLFEDEIKIKIDWD